MQKVAERLHLPRKWLIMKKTREKWRTSFFIVSGKCQKELLP